MASSKKIKSPATTGNKLLGVHFPDNDVLDKYGSGKSKQPKMSTAPAQRQLSRSNDNLASMLRKKAIQSKDGVGKDGIGKDRITALAKTKPQMTKLTLLPVMRKSNSVQAIDNGENSPRFSSRAQSVQNICRIPVLLAARSARGFQLAGDIKRTSSTQNMTNSSSPHPKRSSANAMAYNAELLSNFKKEKKSLEQKISELTQVNENRKAEVEILKVELKNVKESNSVTGDTQEELRLLRSANKMLTEQLHENGITVEHFTDSEKLFLLEQINNENRNPAEATLDDGLASLQSRSEASETIVLDRELRMSFEDLSAIARRYVSSLDLRSLDRHNSLSVDRGLNAISVSDLKDRFLQMQETHYSTNEELQATLQELGDLQDNVNELTSENEKLADERTILLESLCTQTEKLENARLQIEHLKALLIRDSEHEDRSENECQLVALVKSAEEERDELLLKQAEFYKIVSSFENENRELHDIISALTDRILLEESRNGDVLLDKKAVELQLSDLEKLIDSKDLPSTGPNTTTEKENQVRKRQEDTTDCENYSLKNKISVLEQEKAMILVELQDARHELFKTQDEMLKVKENFSSLTGEMEENIKSMKSKIEKLELMLEQKETENVQLMEMRNNLDDQFHQLQQQHDWISEESQLQAAKLQEMDLELNTSKKQQEDLRVEFQEKVNQFQEEQEEWFQFQQDLQMAVVVANDINDEKQEMLDSVLAENQNLKERSFVFLKELTVLKSDKERLSQKEQVESSPPVSSGNRSKFISSVDRDLALLRQGRISSSTPTSLPSNTDTMKNASNQPLSPSFTGTHFRFSKIQLDGFASEVTKSDAVRDVNDVSNSFSADVTDDSKKAKSNSDSKFGLEDNTHDSPKKSLVGILTNKNQFRRLSNETSDNVEKIQTEKSPAISLTSHSSSLSYNVKSDPLASLAKQLGGSKRNALLRWCQNKTATYPGIDITNFSSSWNDGMAFCAILHNFLPDKIPFKELKSQDVMRNFKCAFQAAESVGLTSSSGTDLNDLIATERPDWQAVFSFVTSIYKHFEVDNKS